MNYKVTVSVIVPAYNAERTLRATVDAVIAQTFGDWELLICDDCSADGTFELAQEFARLDPRIRALRNERNMKQAATRNRLIEMARGVYIAPVDADDVPLPNKLEAQVAFMDANPEYAYCSSWIRTMDDDGNIKDLTTRFSGEVNKRDYLWGMKFCHPATMFRTEQLRHMGGYRVHKTTEFRNEDYDLFMRMHAEGMRGYVMPEYLYVYYAGSEALKRRKYRYRWAEAKVRFENFKRLGLMPLGFLYAVKPMIVGLFPQTLLERMRVLLRAGRLL
ncbi:MAG: glycosyltransferase family 2 protein [Oscillospiraceae bacterium]|jgi:glycosyltransferase EpsE|nr:glycosyltransferase family 2 protein [Oscillospiraceae bacterium]